MEMDELARANVRFFGAEPERIIEWAVECFGPRIVMGTGFSPNSAVLLHMVHSRYPGIEAIFVNPGDVSDANLAYADALEAHFPDLVVHRYEPDTPLSQYDRAKIERGGAERLEVYAHRKIEPLRQAIADLGARAVMYGARFDQTEERTRFPIANPDKRINAMRIYPSIYQDERYAAGYLVRHDLPVHPDGYPGGVRLECGIHSTSD